MYVRVSCRSWKMKLLMFIFSNGGSLGIDAFSCPATNTVTPRARSAPTGTSSIADLSTDSTSEAKCGVAVSDGFFHRGTNNAEVSANYYRSSDEHVNSDILPRTSRGKFSPLERTPPSLSAWQRLRRRRKATESTRMQAMSIQSASYEMMAPASRRNPFLNVFTSVPNMLKRSRAPTTISESDSKIGLAALDFGAAGTAAAAAASLTPSIPNKVGAAVQSAPREMMRKTTDAITTNRMRKPVVALSRFVENTVSSRLERWSTHTLNLKVLANARPRALLQGTLGSDVRIQFDRLAFHNLKISGGGLMDVKNIAFDLLTFAPKLRRRRFPKSFEFHAKDFVFLQEDIVESSCIRNGLQNLLNRILNNSGFLHASNVIVQAVDVLPHKKISCKCTATTSLGNRIPFEVRTGLNVTANGHVLTFPGMALSLNPGLGVFVPVLPEIHLDIGHNAKIESVVFNGNRRQIKVNAKVTVTPKKKVRMNYRQQRDSFLAHYACDLGMWVTNLGNFTK